MTTKEEQERIQKIIIERIFNEFDKDDSGEIDKDEFIQGMKRYLRLDFVAESDEYDEVLSAIFKFWDKASFFRKRNNKLDKKEFTAVALAFPEHLSPNASIVLAETLFNLIDENGNGSISKKEFKKFVDKVNKNDGDPIEIFKNVDFNTIDTNTSGDSTKNEFISWFWNGLMKDKNE